MYMQVVKLQPTFIQARLQRGNLFLKMGKFNEAQTDYEAVVCVIYNLFIWYCDCFVLVLTIRYKIV